MVQGNYTPKWLDRFLAKVDATGDCWEWTAHISKGGYGRFQIYPVVHNAHRLFYEWIVGPVTEGLQLDHLCRVRHCVNPDHLEPVTSSVNVRRGNVPRTVNLARRRFTADEIVRIRRSYAAGNTSLRMLGREYGIGYKTIQSIVLRLTYKNIA